jgi:2-(1,2-epoxy-1,2-dihydrophenyl)acetyl-CoA isomerase
MSQLLNDAGEPRLLTQIDGGVAYATINRPEARNAMSSDVREALLEFLLGLAENPEVRVVLIQAAGKSFIAGGDIKAFGEGLEMTREERAADMERRAAGAGRVNAVLSALPQPVIVAARGYAVGVGASLLFASDLTIVSETTKLGLTHVNLGINPDGAGTFFLPRQVGMKRAAQVALLGEMMDAQELLSLGLVNWVVPDAELDQRALALAQKLAAGAPVAQQETKRLLRASLSNDIDAQVAAEAAGLRRCALTDDYAEGLQAILDRRPPRFGQKGN